MRVFFQFVKLFTAAFLFALFYSCTQTIEIKNLPSPKEQIVVEGTIENGEPPFILLTKNSPYFGGISLNDFSKYFVNNANIKVWRNNDTIQLTEYCINNLPQEVRAQIAIFLGFDAIDTTNIPNVCFYSVPNAFAYYITGDTTGVFVGRTNETYFLRIEAEDKVLTSQTTIPGKVPLQPLTWKPHPDTRKDSLVSVYINFRDPDTLGNFYRYATQRNSEQFYYPLSSSVYDDRLVNGQFISLPLERGVARNSVIDNNTYGYFWKGDTVSLKWMNIDKASYDFWRTLENDGGDSPFSSPVIIRTNINGGLGIWCGYATDYATIIVPN